MIQYRLKFQDMPDICGREHPAILLFLFLCFLDLRAWPEGSYELGFVRPSAPPKVFLELDHELFVYFGMGLVTYMKVSLLKVYIICYILAQIPYLGKI